MGGIERKIRELYEVFAGRPEVLRQAELKCREWERGGWEWLACMINWAGCIDEALGVLDADYGVECAVRLCEEGGCYGGDAELCLTAFLAEVGGVKYVCGDS